MTQTAAECRVPHLSIVNNRARPRLALVRTAGGAHRFLLWPITPRNQSHHSGSFYCLVFTLILTSPQTRCSSVSRAVMTLSLCILMQFNSTRLALVSSSNKFQNWAHEQKVFSQSTWAWQIKLESLQTRKWQMPCPDPRQTVAECEFATQLYLGSSISFCCIWEHCTLPGSEIPYRTPSLSDTQIPGQRAGSGCRVK